MRPPNGEPDAEEEMLRTLPDYLAPGLAVVLVGINPSRYSAEVGHYFANPRNRFWRAFNAAGLTPEPLSAGDGLPSAGVRHRVHGPGEAADPGHLGAAAGGVPAGGSAAAGEAGTLPAPDRVLQRAHGVRPVPAAHGGRPAAGQPGAAGTASSAGRGCSSRPNPSPANAAFSLDTLVCWYRKLKELRDGLG